MLRVDNIHERVLPAPTPAVGRLLDTLSGAGDRFWPHERWPRLRLDGGLQPGSTGGHGPVRYEVAEYEPGRRVRFRFTRPAGFDGYHEFRVEAVSGGAETPLTHVMRAEISGSALFSWRVFFRPLHDALIEDALDKAELEVTGAVRSPTSWSPVVRGLRAVGRGARRASQLGGRSSSGGAELSGNAGDAVG